MYEIKNHERNVKNNDLSMHWSKIVMQSALNIDLMNDKRTSHYGSFDLRFFCLPFFSTVTCLKH